MDKIKIVIVDDEKLIREGLKIILETYEDIQVLDLAADGQEAINQVRENIPDLVLMDIRMPNLDGVQATKLIKKEFPDIKILVLTTFTDREYIRQALENGASGYLLKDSDYDVIHEGIIAAIKGNVVIHPNIATKMLSNFSEEKVVDIEAIKNEFNLTDREIDIIRKISEGLNNKEISNQMFLSEGTIKNIITVILSKLNFRDRNQITAFSYKNNLMDMD